MNKVVMRARALYLDCQTDAVGRQTKYTFFSVPQGRVGTYNTIYVTLGSKLAMAFLDGFETSQKLTQSYSTMHKEIRGH